MIVDKEFWIIHNGQQRYYEKYRCLRSRLRGQHQLTGQGNQKKSDLIKSDRTESTETEKTSNVWSVKHL